MKVSPPCQKFLVFAALTIITMKPYIQINSCIYMSNISISALCELSSVFWIYSLKLFIPLFIIIG